MNKTTKVVIGAVMVILVIWGGSVALKSSKAPVSTEPIKIGFIGPLTGDAASIGQNVQAAVKIAVDEVNSAGGINGQPLEIIYEDGKCNGQSASSAANKLINVDKVPVILGGACSGETQAFAAAAEQAETTVLSYCSSAPAITNAGDYIFRNYPSDLYQGSFAADYLANKLGKKKAAIMYVKSDWGMGIRSVFSEAYKKAGGELVADEGYDQTSRDLRTQLAKIKSANPDVIYFLGVTESSIAGIKQAKELGLNIPIFGGDAWDDAKIWTEVGSAGEGVSYSVVSAPLNDSFKAKMKASVGNDEITACTPQAYDAVKLLAQVLKKSGAKSENIKNELYKTKYTGGVSANQITFDKNGDVVGANYIVKTVQNGKAVEVK